MKPRSARPFLTALFILGGALFFMEGFGERTLHLIQRPLLRAGTWIYTQAGFVRDERLTPSEIDELQTRVLDLAIDQVELDELKRENSELKKALQFIKRQDIHVVTSSIIARSQTTQASFFSIDRGSQDGIRVGDPVFVAEGVLIGKVSTLSTKSATIQSLSDPATTTAVSLLNKIQTIGVAEGITGNLLKLKFIPQETSIALNDLVVSSGLETGIPAGLFIGLITDVQPEPNAPFLEAIIEPLVDSREYTIVHVITHTQ